MTEQTGPGEGLPLPQDLRRKERRLPRGRVRGQGSDPVLDGHHVLPLRAFDLGSRRPAKRD